jgi:hypothetical protein
MFSKGYRNLGKIFANIHQCGATVACHIGVGSWCGVFGTCDGALCAVSGFRCTFLEFGDLDDTAQLALGPTVHFIL